MPCQCSNIVLDGYKPCRHAKKDVRLTIATLCHSKGYTRTASQLQQLNHNSELYLKCMPGLALQVLFVHRLHTHLHLRAGCRG